MKERNSESITATEIQENLGLILKSSIFTNAPRASRLLRFLVGKKISGLSTASEYEIGIEVFDRDCTVYRTNEDPIVRVQVGRLRKKLEAYYADSGMNSGIRISILAGCYMPVIQRIKSAANDDALCRRLVIHPFTCISSISDNVHFVHGLNEEFKHQLFKTLGNVVLPYSPSLFDGASHESIYLKHASDGRSNHLIEGSVRMDAENIRVSIRLIDILAGCIAWSEQFDRNILLAVALQEELAASICRALKQFLFKIVN